MEGATYFLEKADQCFRLSRTAERNSELAAELVAMGHEFMAKADALDTARDKQVKAR
jgi:nanoRNase/pAp phosphatase (c-di-AMP/oligoRNAs hydrolase)